MGRYSFTPEEQAGGRYAFSEEEEWVRRGPLLVNTRTGAVKLAPVPAGAKATVKLEGGEVKPMEKKPEPLSPGAAVARGLFGPFASPTFRSYVKEGLASAAELPALAESVVRSGIEKGPLPLGGARGPLTAAKTLKLRGPLADARQSVREEYEGARDQFLEEAVEAGAPPAVAAVAETGVQVGAIAADPTNLLPAGGALKAARKGRYAFTAAEEAGETVAKQAPDIARMTEREIREAALSDIAPLSPGYGADSDGRVFARWLERRGIDPDRAATDHDLKALQDEFFEEMNPEPSLEELGVEVVDARDSALGAPRNADLLRPGAGAASAPDQGLLGRAGTEPGSPGGVPEAEPPPPGLRRPSRRGVATTERGTAIEFDYELRDASTLVTSHDELLRPNPAYPQGLQPRDRTRLASEAQVSQIANRLNPEFLGASPKASDGAPIIDPVGIVESGNARSIGVKRAYAAQGPSAERYRAWLKERAPEFGLDPAAVDRFAAPVLVRVRQTAVDPVAFAREANESAVASFSSTERAVMDAERISPEMLYSLNIPESGELNLLANRDFVRSFASQLGGSDLGSMFDARGALSLDGERRIRNAVLARAYGDARAVARVIEDADSNVRAVGNALLKASPRVARLRDGARTGDLHPLDISDDVGAAVGKLSALRSEGTTVADYLAQGGLFGTDLTPEARAILALFDANARSSGKVHAILDRYADLVEGLGHPRQAGLFGAREIPSKLELLRRAASSNAAAFSAADTATLPVARLGAPESPAATPARAVEAPLWEAPAARLPSIPSTPGQRAKRQRESLERSGLAQPVSTKGLENVAGLEDDIHALAVEHMAELDSARNAPEVLDRLAAQKRGQQVLGGLTAEHTRLRRAVEAEADPVTRAALQERKDLLKRDLVQVLAKQQAGYSEGGKILRQAQDSVDALASDEALKLKNELLKQYQNPLGRPVVAEVEQAAMKRLQREARYATRKGKRAEAKAVLDEEFSALSREFGKKASTPRMGLDPDLAVLVGKMAKNRVQAGFTTIEEIADHVFQQVAPYVEGLTLAQVRATIVSESMAKRRSSVRSLIPDRQQALLKRYQETLDDDVVEKITLLSDDPNSEDLVNFLRQMERPKARDYIHSMAYNNLLLGPKSFVKNTLGNTARRWADIAMSQVEAAVDIPVSALQGRPREYYFRETLPMVIGSYKGVPKGVERALFVLKKGYDPQRLIDDLSGVGSKKFQDHGRLPLDPFLLSKNKGVRAFGAVSGAGSRTMLMADALARSRAHSSASYRWATRQAIKEDAPDVAARAAELLADQPTEMLEYAAEWGRKSTYTDEVSNIGKWLGQGRRMGRIPGVVLNYLARFVNVPDRVSAALADYTPLVRAPAIYRAFREGSPVATELIARQVVGSVFAGVGAAWAFDGKLVGSAPREEKARNDFFASGKQPYSVLAQGEWVPVRDLFGPLAAPLVLAAAYHDSAKGGTEMGAEDEAKALAGGYWGVGRFMFDASYFSGLSDAVEAVQAEPEQGGEKASRLAARTLGSSHIPGSGLLRPIATATDLGPGGSPRVLDPQGPVDEIRSIIPGLRQQVPARYDTMDQMVEQSTGPAGAFSAVVPTENKVADPRLSAYVSRLRRSMEGRARELRQVQEAIATAKLEGDLDREMELRDDLPPVSDPVAVARAAMDQVREKEELIRQNRANKLLPDDFKAYLEAQYMEQVRQILEQSLSQLEAP